MVTLYAVGSQLSFLSLWACFVVTLGNQNLPSPPTNVQAHRRSFRSSGQAIRLRGGRNTKLGAGRVEVFQNGRWGLVCDDHYDILDAHTICKQLGFERGAVEAHVESHFGSGSLRRFTVNSPRCSGTEQSILNCPTNRQTDCDTETETAGVTCRLNYASKCEANEVLFDNRCYYFSGTTVKSNHNDAVNYCSRRRVGGSLAVVQTQAVNDFLSEAIFSKFSSIHDWYTAGIKTSQGWRWKVTRNLDSSTFSKWRPNIQVGSRDKCLTLRHNVQQLTERDYYYWDATNCDRRLSFICEAPVKNIGCVSQTGTTYSGSANTTETGKPCLNWNNPMLLSGGVAFAQQASLKNNLCRNMDDSDQPWCFIGRSAFEACDIPACEQADRGTRKVCEEDEIKCGDAQQCVAKEFLCDYDEDCKNGFDERNCKNWLGPYESSAQRKIRTYIQETWTYIPHAQGCAKRCSEATNFKCVAFSHNSQEQRCVLSTRDIDHGAILVFDPASTYYQLKSSEVVTGGTENCNGKFRCDRTCIDKAKVCDGNNDCRDRTDERNCTNFSIRLVDGDSVSEGRVEVRAFGQWGPVCDDDWDINDANVVCRELGYEAASYAMSGSTYGAGNGQYMMDNVKCLGTEASLEKCQFPGWKQHDCASRDEAAGVQCRTRTQGCQKDEFHCGSNKCISIKWLCDGENDCPDGSDEKGRFCNGPIQIRLANGADSNSGRVEVKYYGKWGTICDDSFDHRDAQVICKMLGKGGEAIVHEQSATQFGRGTGQIWLDEVNCNGNEADIKSCKIPRWGLHDCTHEEDVGITCLDVNRPTPAVTTGECGVRFVKHQARDPRKPKLARVVGGKTVDPGSYPWTAAIRKKTQQHHCGASIIAENYVITAAHCFDEDSNPAVYSIVVGDWNNVGPDGTEQTFDIDRIIKHPSYINVLESDLALVKLKPVNGKGIRYNKYAQPICLPDQSTSYREGLKCVVSGWGTMGTKYPRRMQAALLPIIDRAKCTHESVYGSSVSKKAFCAGFLRGEIDACDGDSGGPFACDLEGKFQLLGLVSWGDGCALQNKPGVYTKINEYLNWINQNMT